MARITTGTSSNIGWENFPVLVDELKLKFQLNKLLVESLTAIGDKVSAVAKNNLKLKRGSLNQSPGDVCPELVPLNNILECAYSKQNETLLSVSTELPLMLERLKGTQTHVPHLVSIHEKHKKLELDIKLILEQFCRKLDAYGRVCADITDSSISLDEQTPQQKISGQKLFNEFLILEGTLATLARTLEESKTEYHDTHRVFGDELLAMEKQRLEATLCNLSVLRDVAINIKDSKTDVITTANENISEFMDIIANAPIFKTEDQKESRENLNHEKKFIAIVADIEALLVFMRSSQMAFKNANDMIKAMSKSSCTIAKSVNKVLSSYGFLGDSAEKTFFSSLVSNDKSNSCFSILNNHESENMKEAWKIIFQLLGYSSPEENLQDFMHSLEICINESETLRKEFKSPCSYITQNVHAEQTKLSNLKAKIQGLQDEVEENELFLEGEGGSIKETLGIATKEDVRKTVEEKIINITSVLAPLLEQREEWDKNMAESFVAGHAGLSGMVEQKKKSLFALISSTTTILFDVFDYEKKACTEFGELVSSLGTVISSSSQNIDAELDALATFVKTKNYTGDENVEKFLSCNTAEYKFSPCESDIILGLRDEGLLPPLALTIVIPPRHTPPLYTAGDSNSVASSVTASPDSTLSLSEAAVSKEINGTTTSIELPQKLSLIISDDNDDDENESESTDDTSVSGIETDNVSQDSSISALGFFKMKGISSPTEDSDDSQDLGFQAKKEKRKSIASISLYPKEDDLLAQELELPKEERIIEYYNCCLFPQPWNLVQGTSYLTQRYFAFRGWPDTKSKRLLALKDIAKVEKENTALVIPNAVRIYMINGEEHFFGSFIERDHCVKLLRMSVEVEKHYSKVRDEHLHLGPSPLPTDRRPSIASDSVEGKAIREDETKADDKELKNSSDSESDVLVQAQSKASSRSCSGEGAMLESSEMATKDNSKFLIAVKKSNLKIAVISESVPISISQFVNLFIVDDAEYSWMKYHERVGDDSLSCSNWEKTDDQNSAVECFSREIGFFKPVNLPGLKETRGIKKQTYWKYGKNGLIIQSSTKLKDVPSASAFSVEDIVCITANGDSVNIDISFEVKFTKSTMLRYLIESSTRTEMGTWLKTMFKYMRSVCAKQELHVRDFKLANVKDKLAAVAAGKEMPVIEDDFEEMVKTNDFPVSDSVRMASIEVKISILVLIVVVILQIRNNSIMMSQLAMQQQQLDVITKLLSDKAN